MNQRRISKADTAPETLDQHDRIEGASFNIVVKGRNVIDMGLDEEGRRCVRLVEDYYLEAKA